MSQDNDRLECVSGRSVQSDVNIRTITTFIAAQSLEDLKALAVAAADFNQQAKNVFTDAGYVVQTTR
jgi:uncharacterized protein